MYFDRKKTTTLSLSAFKHRATLLTIAVSIILLHNCPPWMYFSNATQSCQCGPTLHRVILCIKDGNSSQVVVFFRFCMTQNNEQTKVVVGACPYNRGSGRYESLGRYRFLPTNVTELDKECVEVLLGLVSYVDSVSRTALSLSTPTTHSV